MGRAPKPSDRGQERGHPISCSLWRGGLGHHMPTTGLCTPPTVPRASSAGALAASSCGPHQRPAAGRGFWQKCRIPADLRRMHTNSPSPLRPKHQADIRRDSSPASAFPESLNCSWETNAEMQVIPLLTNTQSKPAGSFPFLPSLRLLTHSARPSTPPTTQEHPPPPPSAPPNASALCSHLSLLHQPSWDWATGRDRAAPEQTIPHPGPGRSREPPDPWTSRTAGRVVRVRLRAPGRGQQTCPHGRADRRAGLGSLRLY